jgi:acyl phosphate:glycerol-3-phosphate acyltransferase
MDADLTLAIALPDVVMLAIAFAGGYLVGSLPVSAWVGKRAGVDVVRDGEANPGSANVWKLAGPGWGMLALSGDLAKGVMPVAIGLATWTWGAGWAAGLGALVGASWPWFGRVTGGRGVAVFAGVAFTLAPAAGFLAVLLTLAVLGIARLLGRNGRVAAIAVGIGVYPLLFYAAEQSLAMLAALMTLYLVAVVRFVTSRNVRGRASQPEA